MLEKIKQIFIGNKNIKNRKIYIDDLRVIATVFVIGVHTVSLAASMTEYGSIAFRVLTIFNYIFLSCNLLFVMLSGALLLPVKNEPAGIFFRKRFTKVAIPLVVYYILYVVAKEGIDWLKPDHWFLMLKRILTGAPVEAPHFWLVYVIIWLYVLTPFIRYIVHNIPDNVLSGVIGVIFIICTLDTYLPLFGVKSVFGIVVDSFAGTFLFGYFLAEKCSRKMENVFLMAGFLAFLETCMWIWNGNNYVDYIYQNSPTMMAFSAAIFILVKRLAVQKTKNSFFVQWISRYSYSILLIHWGVLHFMVKQKLHVDVLSGGIAGGCIVMMVLTLFISAFGAMILDNTLLKWLQIPFSRKKKIKR